MKKLIFTSLLFLSALFPTASFAQEREIITDWYIQDFQSEIVVNRDSSLTITEKITADCGNLPGKHGIFRILPTQINTTDLGIIKTPVKLISITDFDGKKHKYSESRNSSDHTVTWKIGDANKTVTGVNYYIIKYRVDNAIRTENQNFDELYWNLNGNFWDIETDNFTARIIFPEEINKDNTEINHYSGYLGSRDSSLANYAWIEKNILEFKSTHKLYTKQGITASITFPKDIVSPYKPGFWESYGFYLSFLLPLILLIWCFRYWWKYGKDPKINKTVIAQYDPPGNLTPIEMGTLANNGFYNELITAEIVNLATKGLISIEETNNKVLLFNVKDYLLTRKQNKEKEESLIEPQKKILEKIFEEGDKVNLSDLKSTFPEILQQVEKETEKCIMDKKLITASGQSKMLKFVIIGVLTLFAAFFMFISSVGFDFMISGYISGNVFLSGVILIIFGVLMKKRTPEGAELAWEIKGFKLFMKTVDKDRAKFYEKENMFEKLLPYAIMFGITELWIERIKDIYGENYFKTHAPAWYVGSGVGAFSAQSLESAMDSLSSSIASNTSSSSGSGGGGSSGGGGGGGGGGGW